MEDQKKNGDSPFSERRQHERFRIIDGFLTGLAEKEKDQYSPIKLLEISKGGLSFVVPTQAEGFSLNQQINLRICIKDSQSYLPCTVEVVSVAQLKDGSYRHGARLVRGSLNEGALWYLAEFVRSAQVVVDKKSA